MILSITEVKVPFEYYLYEATSAFGTVGITLGLTTKLSSIGKIVILLTMYAGRVGPLTLAIAFARKLKIVLLNIQKKNISRLEVLLWGKSNLLS